MTRIPALAVAGFVVAAAAAACAHRSPPPVVGLSQADAPSSASCGRSLPACSGAPLTYERDVRPILAARCFKCHAGDGVAADEHDFSRVGTLRAQHVALTNEVSTCAMPPSGEPPLPDEEARVLLAWAACGTK